jgi:hypothetical protein
MGPYSFELVFLVLTSEVSFLPLSFLVVKTFTALVLLTILASLSLRCERLRSLLRLVVLRFGTTFFAISYKQFFLPLLFVNYLRFWLNLNFYSP